MKKKYEKSQGDINVKYLLNQDTEKKKGDIMLDKA